MGKRTGNQTGAKYCSSGFGQQDGAHSLGADDERRSVQSYYDNSLERRTEFQQIARIE